MSCYLRSWQCYATYVRWHLFWCSRIKREIHSTEIPTFINFKEQNQAPPKKRSHLKNSIEAKKKKTNPRSFIYRTWQESPQRQQDHIQHTYFISHNHPFFTSHCFNFYLYSYFLLFPTVCMCVEVHPPASKTASATDTFIHFHVRTS